MPRTQSKLGVGFARCSGKHDRSCRSCPERWKVTRNWGSPSDDMVCRYLFFRGDITMTTTTIDFAGQRARLMADRAEAEEARKRASPDNLAGKGDGSLKAARDRLAAIDEQIADLDASAQGVRETASRTVDASDPKAAPVARQPTTREY